MTRAADLIDLDRLAATPLQTEPFPHLIVPGFLKPDAAQAVRRDFPAIATGGSFPTAALQYGPGFAALVAAMESPETTAAFAAKYGVDLAGRPVMVTVRGQSRAKDGRIHTDSKDKAVTALIYMNDAWEADGGRLRLLRNKDSLDDYFAEVPPVQGTLLTFLCVDNAWHGHKPFVGPRRSVQVNWVQSEAVKRREIARHRLSAAIKSIFGKRAA